MASADLEVVNTKVWPDNISFFQTVASAQYPDYIMTFNFRMRNPKGEYVMLLQRSSFIAGDEPGLPAGLIGVAFDIKHYKADRSIIHTIERVVPTPKGRMNELVFKKIHPVLSDVKALLSSRETEILRFMAKGLSSKHIAAEVHLSINTINNHRKNMLAKTGCHSSSELTRFAIMHGLI